MRLQPTINNLLKKRPLTSIEMIVIQLILIILYKLPVLKTALITLGGTPSQTVLLIIALDKAAKVIIIHQIVHVRACIVSCMLLSSKNIYIDCQLNDAHADHLFNKVHRLTFRKFGLRAGSGEFTVWSL